MDAVTAMHLDDCLIWTCLKPWRIQYISRLLTEVGLTTKNIYKYVGAPAYMTRNPSNKTEYFATKFYVIRVQ